MDRNITRGQLPTPKPPVALRKESVDRNNRPPPLASGTKVALRKESVDRNKMPVPAWIYSNVALRKESVDRNAMR